MGFGYVLTSLGRWWLRDAVGTVDQAAVIDKRREECLLSVRYLLMITMSAGIAILGLLLSSPAVVIGAMLLSAVDGADHGAGLRHRHPAISTGCGCRSARWQWARSSRSRSAPSWCS